MAEATKGNCYICGIEAGKTQMKNHLLKAHGKEAGGQECCLLKIEGAHDKDYWLLIDVPMESRLSTVDDFLRDIWLECCGHLSAFRGPKRSDYYEIAMSRRLRDFSAGDKIVHEYDFGTTTESLITFMGSTKRPKQRNAVRLLARNVPPTFQCRECGALADFICTDCMYSTANPFFCESCGDKHEHDDMLLPVVNSPRFGECGYCGERDIFTFDPGKLLGGRGEAVSKEGSKKNENAQLKQQVMEGSKEQEKAQLKQQATEGSRKNENALFMQQVLEGFGQDEELPSSNILKFPANANQPSTAGAAPLRQGQKQSGIISIASIGDYFNSSPDMMQLLGKFGEGYIPEYNKRKASSREEVKAYMNRNFNTWYYSAISPDYEISPARFICSDAFNKYGPDMAVFPVCSPEYSRGKITGMAYSFRTFTLDDHPIVRDLRHFLEAIRDARFDAARDGGNADITSYILLNFSDIAGRADFTFKERPYLIVLGDLCECLSLITMPDEQGGCLYDEGRIEAFFALDGREKLGCVIDELIDRFVECFEGVGLEERPDVFDVLEALQEESRGEYFMEAMFGDMMHRASKTVESLLDSGVESLFSENKGSSELDAFFMDQAKEVYKIQSVVISCCAHFFNVFGQYLQLILPEYDNAFEFPDSDDDYLDMLKAGQVSGNDMFEKILVGSVVYHFMPEGYRVTPLGASWFGIDQHDSDDCDYPLIEPDEYHDVLRWMLED